MEDTDSAIQWPAEHTVLREILRAIPRALRNSAIRTIGRRLQTSEPRQKELDDRVVCPATAVKAAVQPSERPRVCTCGRFSPKSPDCCDLRESVSTQRQSDVPFNERFRVSFKIRQKFCACDCGKVTRFPSCCICWLSFRINARVAMARSMLTRAAADRLCRCNNSALVWQTSTSGISRRTSAESLPAACLSTASDCSRIGRTSGSNDPLPAEIRPVAAARYQTPAELPDHSRSHQPVPPEFRWPLFEFPWRTGAASTYTTILPCVSTELHNRSQDRGGHPFWRAGRSTELRLREMVPPPVSRPSY